MPTSFQISENSSVDMVIKLPVFNCSLEKYYFQSLLKGVFINKKQQLSDFRMLDKTEKEPVYYYLYMGEVFLVVPANEIRLFPV